MSHAVPERDNILRALAGTLASRGLRMPALVALSAGRPVIFLLSQLLWIAQPAASLFWHRSQIESLAHLLEDEQSLAQLQSYLNVERNDA